VTDSPGGEVRFHVAAKWSICWKILGGGRHEPFMCGVGREVVWVQKNSMERGGAGTVGQPALLWGHTKGRTQGCSILHRKIQQNQEDESKPDPPGDPTSSFHFA